MTLSELRKKIQELHRQEGQLEKGWDYHHGKMIAFNECLCLIKEFEKKIFSRVSQLKKEHKTNEEHDHAIIEAHCWCYHKREELRGVLGHEL